ncbi:MAG: hypothetical protein Q8P30_01005 [Candidatus Uhrbacteria bacterium]|nr:hypothetical protein [Candidatus Uhrbacteria bacterium]
MRTIKFPTIIVAIAIVIVSALVSPNQAFAYDQNYILSDWDLTDPFALDLNQIQNFLERGYLADYKTEDSEGDVRYAADIIWNAAQNYNISPKFLLVLLQKEQSLIEDDSPTEKQLSWATGYAVCDDCSMSAPSIQRWKGFGKQVNSAAMQFSEGYLADIEATGSTQGKYGPGIPVEIDGEIIVPANAATAAMYAYTPHIHGNINFSRIWERWFSIQYPSGTLLKIAGESGVYLIEYGYKRPIESWSALLSRFNPSLMIEVAKNSLDLYPDGNPIAFPNYSLLQDDDGNIYLLVDDSLRHIDSMETFRYIGFAEDEIVKIENDDLAYFEKGLPLTMLSADPGEQLLQLSSNGAMFYIKDGYRHAITDKAILTARFPNAYLQSVQAVVVEQYAEGRALTLPDGYLIKSTDSPAVYVISEGERRSIGSEEIFLSYGWSWDDIVELSPSALNLHPLGLAIDNPLDTLMLATE